jgi:hypothetical protein
MVAPRFSICHDPDADLVDHLGQLAAARRPEEHDGARVAVDHRLRLLEMRRFAAAHDGQHAVFRPRLPAGDRRIDEADTLLRGQGRDLAGDVGRGRGVVDQHRALGHAGQGAVIAEDDRAEVLVVADAGENQLRALDRLARRFGQASAMPLHRIAHDA